MFIAQAVKYPHDFWRYLIGSVLVIIASVIGQIPLVIAMVFEGGIEKLAKGETSMQEAMNLLNTNWLTFLMLFSFAVGFVGLYGALKGLHQQPFKLLTTTRRKIDWKRIFFGFSLVAVFTIVVTIIDFKTNPGDYIFNFQPIPFLILFCIAIVMVPIQTSLEEYVFRGYLMQGFGLFAKNRWFPLLMTSLIFGGLHFFNPEVGQMGNIIMVYYIGTGLFLGIITLMDEGMELSLGFHAGNNLIGVLLVTADWTAFQSESILKDISKPSEGLDVLFPVLIIYPIFLLIMAKVYRWNNWKEKLFGKIEVSEISSNAEN
ncbi:CPBP family intramembrane glutamic endopeptidase [Mesonia aquimarina]|uniref:CPBP family intramembrane glutamic endopeptidase n=1 Tax=Mesonia aquimarina TaxID=1504967 RepID=UPI000EF5C12D|nr:CPBP family intramembrane glutamic endopeptidase [Mesonia aquimarina]